MHAMIMMCFLFWNEHLVSRSGAQQVCTLDLLSCLCVNGRRRCGGPYMFSKFYVLGFWSQIVFSSC